MLRWGMEWRNFHWNCKRFSISPRVAKISVALESGDCEHALGAARAVSWRVVYMRRKKPGETLIEKLGDLAVENFGDFCGKNFLTIFGYFLDENRLKFLRLTSFNWRFKVVSFLTIFRRYSSPAFLFFACRFIRTISYWLLHEHRRRQRERELCNAEHDHIAMNTILRRRRSRKPPSASIC